MALVAVGSVALGAVGLALALPKMLARRPPASEAQLNAVLQPYRDWLTPGSQALQLLHQDFRMQISEGLQSDVAVDGKKMLMLPTYVTRMPDGSETGDCYALDLGGTNFRVMRVRLGQRKGAVRHCDVEEVSLPKEVYTGTGDKLFDFLASTVKQFIDRDQAHGPAPASAEDGDASAAPPRPLPVLGFCFSFAVKQTGLNSGILLDWTKGFTCTGVVGNDPVALLSRALERAGRPCRVAVLLNDTVGVLAAQRYLDANTQIGVIIGTGTNACYVERLGCVTKWQPPSPPSPTQQQVMQLLSSPSALREAADDSATAINMEWGAFYSQHLPRCPEDSDLDDASPHRGKYLFEKLLSGMFLGEAARRILATVSRQVPELFGGAPATSGGGAAAAAGPFARAGEFTSAMLASVVQDRSPGLATTRKLLCKQLGIARPGWHGARVVQEVCTLVARRSAVLAAMALLAVLDHTGWLRESSPRRVTVAFDGGVYERFGAYRCMLKAAIRQQLGPRARQLMPRLRFVLTHDGSAFGAAVLAAAAVHGA